MIKETIERAVKEALTELGAGDAPYIVSRPTEMSHGDYATNAALSAAKSLKKNPKEVAQLLAAKLTSPSANPLTSPASQPGLARGPVEKIEVAGAGFINFFLSKETIAKEVARAATDTSFGKNSLHAGKKIMVEYTDPNPFKEFHIGHLMSNAIGESIARVLEASGASVVRANYQGDVGPHVAKALFILLERQNQNPSIKDISAAYVEGSKRYEENADDKEAIDQLNKKIYSQEDKEVNALYTKGRELTLAHFEELYTLLGTKFDKYYFESKTAPIGLATVGEHPEVFAASEGATVFKGESYGMHTRVFVTKLGLPTYEAKELGLVVEKQKEKCDEYVYITANEQSEYFKVVFLAAKLVFPNIEGKLVHRSHGMMRFASGKMSSRLGNVVTGESLLTSLTDAAKEKMQGRDVDDVEKIAEEVAVGAIKYVVLKQNTGKDIIFDPEKSLSTEGDSGPYLQYAHTRASSLIREAKKAEISAEGSLSQAAGRRGDAYENDPSARSALSRLILHYPDALARAAEELEPHHVTTYVTELASAFNSWYASERAIVDGKIASDTLELIHAVKNILSGGLNVLGIKALPQM